jgi:outer membrane immunogenic protein
MRRFLLASADVMALAGWIGAASAADMSRPFPPYSRPAYSPVYNWTGLYAGINGGYGWGSSTWNVFPSSFDTNGGLFGGQLGYNWQSGQFVTGLEGDIDWSGIRGNAGLLGCGVAPCQTKNDFLSTVRGRVGYAADRWMPYVTGGLAIGNIRTVSPGFPGIDQTNAGWTIGAGLELALIGNWTGKAEYLYVDLGKVGCGFNCGLPANNNVSFTTNIIRGGINYRF